MFETAGGSEAAEHAKDASWGETEGYLERKVSG
jgi:hypothetical protein